MRSKSSPPVINFGQKKKGQYEEYSSAKMKVSTNTPAEMFSRRVFRVYLLDHVDLFVGDTKTKKLVMDIPSDKKKVGTGVGSKVQPRQVEIVHFKISV
jgi:hypothetical protein